MQLEKYGEIIALRVGALHYKTDLEARAQSSPY